MENGSYIALSRQVTLKNELEIIANNIANANTTAFKGEKIIFREFMVGKASKYQEKLSFVQDVGLARDLSEGPLITTGNSFDIAINGNGFIELDTPSGLRYTRQGHMQLDSESRLINSKGFFIMGNNGVINIPLDEGEIYIANDGVISTDISSNIAKLKIVGFEDQQAMTRGAHGVYATKEEPFEITSPKIIQGHLENSNVKPIIEMTRMMTLLQEYKSVKNYISKEHERQQKTIERLGKVAS